jgi:hypothetical protein
MYRILDRPERFAAAVVSAVCIAPTFIRLQALVHQRNVSDYLQVGMAVSRGFWSRHAHGAAMELPPKSARNGVRNHKAHFLARKQCPSACKCLSGKATARWNH